jgi:hypothetical protein
MSTESPTRPLLRAILRPAARFCARHALKVQDVIDCFKAEFLAVAEDELKKQNAKVTRSRLSVLTGIQRREIDRLLQGAPAKREQSNLIFRIINQWRMDPRFATKNGEPKVLSLTPESGDFPKLVASVSSDIGPATVLFEMERLSFIEHTPRGVRLLVENFIPRGAEKVEEGADILSADLGDLAETVSGNILDEVKPPLHHLRTEYDKIRPDGLAHLQSWFLREGHAFHLRARAELAKFDQDVNPDPNFSGNTARVSFSSFNRIVSPQKKTEER